MTEEDSEFREDQKQDEFRCEYRTEDSTTYVSGFLRLNVKPSNRWGYTWTGRGYYPLDYNISDIGAEKILLGQHFNN